MKKILIVCFLILCTATLSYAEVIIHLKSGRTIKGNLVERTDKYITIELYGGNITYWLNDIEKVDVIETIKEPPKETSAVVAPQAIQEPSAEFVPQSPAVAMQKKPPLPTLPGIMTKENGYLPIPVDMDKVRKFIAVALPMLITFSLLLYIYCALCLHIIANKTLTPNSWFAWIPILNLILMCDIAKKPRWWILLFLIPFVGAIIAIIISIILWVRIAESRNKPIWLGILMILPPINFFIMGYLAFSDGAAAPQQGKLQGGEGSARP